MLVRATAGREETADRRGVEPCSLPIGRNTWHKLDGGEVKVLCKF